MNIYNVSWNVIADEFPLMALRKPLVRIFTRALVLPFQMLHIDFLNYREKSLYRIGHNSQICYMEAVLNDLFDNSLRRIRIVNVAFKEPIYFYEPEENRDVLFYEPGDDRPVFFREPEDFAGEGVDFVVCVPPVLQPGSEAAELAYLTRMGAQIEFYKLYSKNYKIVWEQVDI